MVKKTTLLKAAKKGKWYASSQAGDNERFIISAKLRSRKRSIILEKHSVEEDEKFIDWIIPEIAYNTKCSALNSFHFHAQSNQEKLFLQAPINVKV